MDTHQRREQGAGRVDDQGWGGDARPTCSKGQALTLSPPGPRHPPVPGSWKQLSGSLRAPFVPLVQPGVSGQALPGPFITPQLPPLLG